MKDIIDGINYWIFWYEYRIWSGGWSIFHHLVLMGLMFYFIIFGIFFIKYKIILKTILPVEVPPFIALVLTLCLAIYLLWKRRYRRILTRHDKFRKRKYIILTISIVVITMVLYLGPYPYLALTHE